jgi:hypothetical protein
VLELQRLTRRDGDMAALDGLSFTVAEGQTFGFIGPNGGRQDHRHAHHPRRAGARRRPSPMVQTPMTDRMSKRSGHMLQDHGQTFSPTVRSLAGCLPMQSTRAPTLRQAAWAATPKVTAPER